MNVVFAATSFVVASLGTLAFAPLQVGSPLDIVIYLAAVLTAGGIVHRVVVSPIVRYFRRLAVTMEKVENKSPSEETMTSMAADIKTIVDGLKTAVARITHIEAVLGEKVDLLKIEGIVDDAVDAGPARRRAVKERKASEARKTPE